MMKKLMSLLLALLMLLTLAACGGSDAPAEEPTEEPAAEKPAAEEPAAEEPAAEEPAAEEPAAEEPEEGSAEDPATLGRMQGGTYTNSYAGYTLTLDEDWTFYTAEELQEIPENARETMEGTVLGEAMDDYEQITDMMAENSEDLQSVNLLYQKLSLSDRLSAATLTDEDIIDMMLEEMGDTMIESYEQAGMTVNAMEKKTVTFLGEERAALYTFCTMSEIDIYMIQLIDYTRGEYSLTLTVGAYVEDTTQDVLDLFQPIA